MELLSSPEGFVSRPAGEKSVEAKHGRIFISHLEAPRSLPLTSHYQNLATPHPTLREVGKSV